MMVRLALPLRIPLLTRLMDLFGSLTLKSSWLVDCILGSRSDLPQAPSHARSPARQLCLAGLLHEAQGIMSSPCEAPRSVLEKRARVVGALEQSIISMAACSCQLVSPANPESPALQPRSLPRRRLRTYSSVYCLCRMRSIPTCDKLLCSLLMMICWELFKALGPLPPIPQPTAGGGAPLGLDNGCTL